MTKHWLWFTADKKASPVRVDMGVPQGWEDYFIPYLQDKCVKLNDHILSHYYYIGDKNAAPLVY